jgi:predicted methyltransferase
LVFDFDERICNAVTRFADKERIETLESKLYNCLDALPEIQKFDCFYTNPPWGASNDGESVKAFAQRGMEATQYDGEGLVVIADDHQLAWPQTVLRSVQRFAIDNGYFVQKMMPRMHNYHLDDAPDLRSCNLLFKSIPGNIRPAISAPISDPERLRNFYGKDSPPKVKYVRERKRVDYGNALDEEYEFESIEVRK